jgi:hypothetical protein
VGPHEIGKRPNTYLVTLLNHEDKSALFHRRAELAKCIAFLYTRHAGKFEASRLKLMLTPNTEVERPSSKYLCWIEHTPVTFFLHGPCDGDCLVTITLTRQATHFSCHSPAQLVRHLETPPENVASRTLLTAPKVGR